VISRSKFTIKIIFNLSNAYIRVYIHLLILILYFKVVICGDIYSDFKLYIKADNELIFQYSA
jgi:hypothetical protein